MKKLANKIRNFTQNHRTATSFCYVASAAVLVVLLAVIGVIPGFNGGPQTPRPEQQQQADARRTKAPRTSPDSDDRSAQKAAEEDMKRMNDLLDSQTGVNDATLRQYLLPQSGDGQSEYSKAEYRFTDLVKEATTPGVSGAKPSASQIDDAYSSWESAAWKAANQSLHSNVVEMMNSARPGRDYLKKQEGYPAVCGRYAAYEPSEKTGTTKADFDSTVGQIARFDDLLQQCSVAMTPDQAARMPQDAA